MDKIQKAQNLADMLLDEMEIKQVGGDKGALKDEPESIQKSEDDIEDYVEDGAPKKKVKEDTQISTMVGNLATYLGEASLGAKIQRGIARNDKNYEEGNDMDPTAKANAKKRAETVKENNIRQDRIDRKNKGYETHEKRKSSWEEKHGGNVKNFDNGYGKTGGSFVDLKNKENIMGYKRNDRKNAMRKAMTDFHLNRQKKKNLTK